MDNIYESVIEALIFASDEPLKASEIINAITSLDGDENKISVNDIEDTVDKLNLLYSEQKRSFHILKIAEGFVFGTREEYAKYLGYLAGEKSSRRLSQSALETLSIIAYKQPITKPELEGIRGVNCDYVLNTLLEKRLINITGRAETVGRPLLYGTTTEFLQYFGLNKLTDLPKPREIEDIMMDDDFLEQRRKIMMAGLEEQAEKNEQGQHEQSEQPSEN